MPAHDPISSTSPATVGVENTQPPVSYCHAIVPTFAFWMSAPSCGCCAPSRPTLIERSTRAGMLSQIDSRIIYLQEQMPIAAQKHPRSNKLSKCHPVRFLTQYFHPCERSEETSRFAKNALCHSSASVTCAVQVGLHPTSSTTPTLEKDKGTLRRSVRCRSRPCR